MHNYVLIYSHKNGTLIIYLLNMETCPIFIPSGNYKNLYGILRVVILTSFCDVCIVGKNKLTIIWRECMYLELCESVSESQI